MDDLIKAKATLYLALMDADLNVAQENGAYLKALLADPDIKAILAKAMPS